MLTLRPPIAVFDLDGTLADTIYDLVGTLNAVLENEGLPPLSLEEGRPMIGAGAKALIERGLSAARCEVTPARLDELCRLFLTHYSENICIDTTLFPGTMEALDRLEAAGFRLAVCTNKYASLSVSLLQTLAVADRFSAICGRDTFPYYKPDPRHLLMTIEKAGGDQRRAVMVGDSLSDVAAAKAAGIPVVAVTFGYSDVPVADLAPDRVIDHFDDLFPTVQLLVQGAAA